MSRITFTGVPPGAVPLALAEALETAPALIHVAVNDRAMDQLAAALPFFTDAQVVRFPAWDCLPYDRVSPRPALVAERVKALAGLAATQGKRIILTTASSFLQRVPPAALMREAVLMLAPGVNIPRGRLLAFLAANGYRRAGKAIEPGEYALRGGIVDLIPAGEQQGMRLDFFGDELESLRAFDPMTQLTSGPATPVTLHPAGEVPVTEERVARFRAAYREQFGAVSKHDPLYEAISAGQHYPGMEHWLPLFFERLERITDYAPDATVVLDAEAETAMAERQEAILDYYEARREAMGKKSAGEPYNPLPPQMLYVMQDETAGRRVIELSPFAAESGTARNWRAAPIFAGAQENPFAQLKEYVAARPGKPVVLACISAGSAERIAQLAGMPSARIEKWEDAEDFSLAVLPLEHGFETESAALITEQDLLGERIIRARPKKRDPGAFLAEAANFNEGELVVHREHGIGRFEGLVTLEVAGAKHDCLKLVYEGDDKLFLPVENIDLLSRFGAEEEGAKLDKLGAASWQARKSRMKERIRLAAEALMKTAAERLMKTAPVLETPSEKYDAFCARFGFVETEDQARSIEEVLEDLTLGRPMDRLVCGDVGFGKTEVALRAAFVATHSTPKVQVAVVVPTTLLARQHYANFRARFDGLPIRVAQLSRMVGAAEQKRVHEGIADGTVDIVVGTHALLSKSIVFENLGLVIVDEEQHFGVAQKEKLKSLRSEVHVLTLSATPIPRTLQLAMSGVRSLSLIATPPVDRLAVRSFVMPFDAVVMREAILREMHRGGRVFAVTPRIRDMGDFKNKLTELAPEAKIALAHGQMPASELDSIMSAFYEGKYDVLLSTAIIESGLDIPQANTMIINHAQRFGLSQLYQLRGRVGRGKLRAYAYFLLPPQRELTPAATRRLEVMQSLDTLGAGFTLASHDMDIRGFGNLVGEEQSGHIREVGIELYQQMLEEAVTSLKSERTDAKVSDEFSPQINLGMAVLIPEEYVDDLSLRMGLYRRAAALGTPADIDSFAAELIDRFGPLPAEVTSLLDTVRLKQLCRAAGIARIDAGPKGAVLGFYLDKFDHPEKLLAYISRHPTTLKLRPDQKLVYLQEWDDGAERMKDVIKRLEEIGALRV